LKRYKIGVIGFAIIRAAGGQNRPRLFGVLKIEIFYSGLSTFEMD